MPTGEQLTGDFRTSVNVTARLMSRYKISRGRGFFLNIWIFKKKEKLLED